MCSAGDAATVEFADQAAGLVKGEAAHLSSRRRLHALVEAVMAQHPAVWVTSNERIVAYLYRRIYYTCRLINEYEVQDLLILEFSPNIHRPSRYQVMH